MNTQLSKKWFRSCYNSFKIGLNLGHKSINLSRSPFWHPLMSQYLLGIRHDSSILNIQETQKALLRAFYIIAFILKQNGHITIINTNPEFSKICTNFSLLMQGHKHMFFKNLKKTFSNLEIVKNPTSSLAIQKNSLSIYKKMLRVTNESAANKTAQYKISCNALSSPNIQTKKNKRPPTKQFTISYSNYKWVGGTLTNWKQISKSVLTFAKFSERCEDFCIKNSIHFPRYKKIKKSFQGLLYSHQNQMFVAFQEKPDLIFLVNPHENRNIINEATRLNIPIIAFTQSHTNIHGITYPIAINNYSLNFLYFSLKKITKISSLIREKSLVSNKVSL